MVTDRTLDWGGRPSWAAAAVAWTLFTAVALCGGQAGAGGSESGFNAAAREAEAARSGDRLEEAAGLYRKALGLRPGWVEGWWALGTILYDRQEYEGAAGAFRQLVRLKPDSGRGFAMLGLSEAKLGRRKEALRDIRRARSLGADRDETLRNPLLYNEGVLLLAGGAYGEAQETLDTLCREGLAEPELIQSLGSAVLGIRPAQGAGGDEETNRMIWQAGWAEHWAAQRDKLAEALREYKRLAVEFPRSRNVQFAYGRMLLANHYDDEAMDAFRLEIENTPTHVLARLGIAGIEQAHNPAGGLPYAAEAVRLAPGLAEAHYLYGVLLLETGNAPASIPELEAARRAEPEEAKIYFALAKAYRATGRERDAAQARESFRRLSEEATGNATTAKSPGPKAAKPVTGNPSRKQNQ
jgi:predicted Zn-dependent protease